MDLWKMDEREKLSQRMGWNLSISMWYVKYESAADIRMMVDPPDRMIYLYTTLRPRVNRGSSSLPKELVPAHDIRRTSSVMTMIRHIIIRQTPKFTEAHVRRENPTTGTLSRHLPGQRYQLERSGSRKAIDCMQVASK